MNHDELSDLLPAFALNAVSAADEMNLRAHLDVCTECADLMETYQETAGMLAFSTAPVQPSEGLRDRILNEASRTPEATPINQKAQRRWGLERVGALVGAAAVMAAAVFGGWTYRQLRIHDQRIEETGRAFAVVNSPQVDVVSMSSARTTTEGARGQVFVQDEGDAAALVLTGLRNPGPKTYALWLINNGKPRALKNFRPDEEGVAVLFVDRSVGAAQTMAVTLEPREGTTIPLGPVVLSS